MEDIKKVIDHVCDNIRLNDGNTNIIRQLDAVLQNTDEQFTDESSDIKVGCALFKYLLSHPIRYDEDYHLNKTCDHILKAMAQYAMYEISLEEPGESDSEESETASESEEDADDE